MSSRIRAVSWEPARSPRRGQRFWARAGNTRNNRKIIPFKVKLDVNSLISNWYFQKPFEQYKYEEVSSSGKTQGSQEPAALPVHSQALFLKCRGSVFSAPDLSVLYLLSPQTRRPSPHISVGPSACFHLHGPSPFPVLLHLHTHDPCTAFRMNLDMCRPYRALLAPPGWECALWGPAGAQHQLQQAPHPAPAPRPGTCLSLP